MVPITHLQCQKNYESKKSYIINLYHFWLIVFVRISLSLDEKEIAATRLTRGTKDIEAPSQGGLYLGGLRKSNYYFYIIKFMHF